MTYLELSNITKKFGGLRALDEVNFDAEKGNITGLIGPNGAGKTTMFNIIMGVLSPDTGSVVFDGDDITGLPTQQIVKRGVSRTFQTPRVYPEFTVETNIELALMEDNLLDFDNLIRSGVKRMIGREHETTAAAEANELLQWVGLDRDLTVDDLTHLQRNKLGLARALATGASLMLLDEPFAGVTAEERLELSRIIERMNDERDVTVVVIDHNMEAINDLCDTITVLDRGRRIAEGPPTQIQQDENVREVYLGSEV